MELQPGGAGWRSKGCRMVVQIGGLMAKTERLKFQPFCLTFLCFFVVSSDVSWGEASCSGQ